MFKFLLKIICISLLIILTQCENDPDEIRIGIIGAGIGGTSTAYYLRSLFGNLAKIDIFESDRVGGRLANINIDGLEYEAGGSIIHPKNKYMLEFTEKFGFKQKKSSDGKMAIFSPSGIVLETSSWGWITMAKFFWRYGFDILNIGSLIKDNFLDQFERIYKLQDEGYAFTSVEDLLKSMDEKFVNLTKISLRDFLKDKGFSDRFINELVTGGMRTNYGQTPEAHAFVGAVCLAGIEHGLWSVQGGNYQIPERLLKKSGANLIEAKVSHVILQREASTLSYEVQYSMMDNEKQNSREYDIVVVATPLKPTTNIKFEDFPNPVPSSYTEFHRTIALFVQGTPNYTTYGFQNGDNFPGTILTTDENIFWNSYSRHTPVTNKKHLEKNDKNEDESDQTVSKIFLNKTPTELQVGQLFQSRKDLRVVDWSAYPEYKPGMELPPFVLYDQLYYVNAIETAASAMEMSVIGGRNIANLAYNHWNNNLDKIDEINKQEESKKEEL